MFIECLLCARCFICVTSFSYPRGRKNSPYLAPHSKDKDAKAQKNPVTCPILYHW